MTEEAMGRHYTARHEVSSIKERAYCWSKEVERKDLSGSPLPSEGLIQARRRLTSVFHVKMLRRCGESSPILNEDSDLWLSK